MKIYSKTDIELLDVNVSDESYRYREIMGSPTLTLYFSLNSFTELPVDCYVDFQGERFYLFDAENFRKNSPEDFEYTLILHGIAEKLTRFRFYDFVNGGLIFPLTAKPADHIAMLVNVLNAKDSGWSAGTVTDVSEIVVNYNHNSCMEALGMIAQESELEFEITPAKVIHLRKTEYNKTTPLAIAYGFGNGLKPGIERKNDNKGRPVEKLYVQGGERNIDFSAYGSRYLLLPKSQQLIYNSKTYAADAAGLYVYEVGATPVSGQEASLDASTIYPSRVGLVTDVEIIDADGNLYNIIDNTIPASLDFEEYRIAGQAMSIVFQTGILAGKEFNVTYFHEFNRFEIEPKDIDSFKMPGGVWLPVIGDTFVVFGCSFPAAYMRDDATKTGASWDMMREAVIYLCEHSDEKYSYGGSVSPIWLKATPAAQAKLILGGYCSLTDPELGSVLIRIRSIKDYVTHPYDVDIDLSNALVKPSFSTTMARIDAFTASLTLQQLIEAREAAIAAGLSADEITQIINNLFPDFGEITGDPMTNSALAEYLRKIGLSSYTDTQTRLISGTVLWLTGMTYESTDFVYKILGLDLTAPRVDAITLAASDPTLNRIDVFYLDLFGSLKVKTGTPGANPVAPTLTQTELYVTSAYVAAGSTAPSDIIIEIIYEENAVDEWATTVFAEAGKTSIDAASLVEPYAGTKHIKMSVAVPLVDLGQPLHYIGEPYQGGKIFWIDPASDGTKGLIAAEFDTVTDMMWSTLKDHSPYTTGATDKTIGAGQANTTLMLANSAAAGYAAKYAAELIIDGYDDWFIGSLYEMNQLYLRRWLIGNFNPTKNYWSSTEVDWENAWPVNFDNGGTGSTKKTRTGNVRAIRAFDDTVEVVTSQYVPQDTSLVFTAPATVEATSGILSFRMKTLKPWLPNSIFLIETYNGAVRTGSCALSPVAGLFGFNPANNEDYQLTGINSYNFALTQPNFNAVKFVLAGAWENDSDIYIDSVRFQRTEAVQQRAPGVPLQVQGLVLETANWVLDVDKYVYTLENVNITDTSMVDVIPVTADLETINAAGMYPETECSAGQVEIYAETAPTAAITVTIIIMEVTL